MQKPDKKNYSNVKSYYPIAFFNTTSKVLQSVVATPILYLVELHHFSPFTHIKDSKSSLMEHAIHYLVENTYTAWNKRHLSLALFLDITSVFNNVSHKKLLYNLCKREINKSVIKWIKLFFIHCNTTLKTSKYIKEKLVISI